VHENVRMYFLCTWGTTTAVGTRCTRLRVAPCEQRLQVHEGTSTRIRPNWPIREGGSDLGLSLSTGPLILLRGDQDYPTSALGDDRVPLGINSGIVDSV
jgi:hypothetical protein